MNSDIISIKFLTQARMLRALVFAVCVFSISGFNILQGAGGFFSYMIWSGIYYFINKHIQFARMMSVTAYSWLVVAVGMLIKTPIILSKQSINVHFSPATFLSNEKAFIYKVLAQFDLFNIWCFFIVTIGIAIMTGRKTKQVWPITAIFFVLYFLGAATMQSVLQSAFGF